MLHRSADAKDDGGRRRRRTMYVPNCDGTPCTDDRNMRRVALAPCEMRWPLLQEGPYAFLMVLGLSGQLLRTGSLRQVFGEVLLLGFMHAQLNQGHRKGRPLGEPRRQCHGGVHQLCMWHDFTAQSHAERLLAVART